MFANMLNGFTVAAVTFYSSFMRNAICFAIYNYIPYAINARFSMQRQLNDAASTQLTANWFGRLFKGFIARSHGKRDTTAS